MHECCTCKLLKLQNKVFSHSSLGLGNTPLGLSIYHDCYNCTPVERVHPYQTVLGKPVALLLTNTIKSVSVLELRTTFATSSQHCFLRASLGKSSCSQWDACENEQLNIASSQKQSFLVQTLQHTEKRHNFPSPNARITFTICPRGLNRAACLK